MSTVETHPAKWIGADSAGLRMTPEEFDSFEEGEWDELYRYELVNGVLVVREFESDDICDLNQRLSYEFWRWIQEQGHAAKKHRAASNRYLFLRKSRRLVHQMVWIGITGRPRSTDIPAIAVDFLSPGTRYWKRDYEARCDEYLSAGVREYWIFDRFDRTLTVHRRTDDGEQTEVFNENEVYRPVMLPGFELSVEVILAEADGAPDAQDS